MYHVIVHGFLCDYMACNVLKNILMMYVLYYLLYSIYVIKCDLTWLSELLKGFKLAKGLSVLQY